MPQKLPPIYKKAWDLISFSIPMKKLQKPIKQNLLTFKRSRKNRRRLLKYHDYAFIEEFQFSPSSTPLFHHYKAQLKKTSCRSLSSIFLLCYRAGTPTIDGFDAVDESIDPKDDDNFPEEPELTCSIDESDSVDKRAEIFIARFYADIRMQRQASMLQYT